MRAGRAMRGLGEGALELLCPTRCVGCNRPGTLLCEDCRSALRWIEPRWACPVCGAPYGWLTCTCCDGSWELDSITCALEFSGTASQLVTILKDQHELRLAPVAAAAMATALDVASAWHQAAPPASRGPGISLGQIDAICFVPATARAYARRGFDHMELVSRALSRETGLPVADVLVRDEALDQRQLGARERADNLSGTIGVLEDVGGLRLLLADDVVTTGSTMREAARALLARGAREVHGCALARVW